VIGLAWDLDSLTVAPMGEAEVDGPADAKLQPGERLSVRRTRHGALCFVRGGRKPWQAAMWRGDTLWMTATEGGGESPARLFRWNNRSWRGQIKIFVNARGSLTVATRLPLETYLLGVLPGEIGPLNDELKEAGRAQAMAARSFTLFYTGRRGVEGFDLFSTVEDQVYGSVESERPLATECVRSTAGQVATYGGQPIRANYSSTCGGITADVWEAWPDPPRPYLRSRRDAGAGADYCQASPHYRWHEEWSVAEFLANLRKFGPSYGVPLPASNLGQLRDVRVRSRSRSGRVWVLDVTTSEGHVLVPAYSLRQVLRRPGNPAAILRSNLFKIGVRRDERSGRVLAVVANGAGSGHGVGLCQTGALGMARAGVKGEDIIRHYFAAVEIRRQY
jgi:stage II sporulation protein D